MIYKEYKKPQTVKLIDMSKNLHRKNTYKVRQAIYELFEEGRPITVREVALRAGVSRNTVYNNKKNMAVLNYFAKTLQNMPIIAKDYRVNYESEYRKIGDIQSLVTSEEEIEKLLSINTALKAKLSRLQFELDFYKRGGTPEEFK